MRKEEVRAILQLPRELLNDMQEIDDRIEEYRRTFLRSPVYSHLPKSRTGIYHDLSDRATYLEELVNTKAEMEADCSAARGSAMELITKISNPMICETLRRYYILGEELGEIAESSGKGYHAVYQQIRRAWMRLSEMEE